MKFLLALLLSTAAWSTNYSVRAFGAKGDGSTDDTAAIQATINAAQGAASNSGDVVWFPRGQYKVTGLTATSNKNLVMRGVGYSSMLMAAASSTVFLSMTDGLGGLLSTYQIEDMSFNGSAFAGVNTQYGIKLINCLNIKLQRLLFYNVLHAISMDRTAYSFVSDIQLLDNSTIYVGSTVDGVSQYSTAIQLRNINHIPTNAPGGSFTYTGAILNFERAVNTTLFGFTANNLNFTAKGISVRNDSQGLWINGGAIVSSVVGIEVVQNTVGATTAKPLDCDITGIIVDQFNQRGISAVDGYFTRIDNVRITGGVSGATFGVYFGGNNVSPSIRSSLFQGGTLATAAIAMDGGATGFAIENNSFSVNSLGGGVDIYVVTAGSSHYIITGNMRDSLDTAALFLTDNGSAPKTVADNQN